MRQEEMKSAVALCKKQQLLNNFAGDIKAQRDPVFDGLVVGLDEIYTTVDTVFNKLLIHQLLAPDETICQKQATRRNSSNSLIGTMFHLIPAPLKEQFGVVLPSWIEKPHIT
ncbi:unnamed protein product [Phytophthora lilii]|uniref:Unnamed protein product n=1 Tax=Phytophthora lilii TaxID=2077276 RepID=A0A9W6U8F4_9STRA|nr:unnamed protein product [Phytophthora lilii]